VGPLIPPAFVTITDGMENRYSRRPVASVIAQRRARS